MRVERKWSRFLPEYREGQFWMKNYRYFHFKMGFGEEGWRKRVYGTTWGMKSLPEEVKMKDTEVCGKGRIAYNNNKDIKCEMKLRSRRKKEGNVFIDFLLPFVNTRSFSSFGTGEEKRIFCRRREWHNKHDDKGLLLLPRLLRFLVFCFHSSFPSS